MDRRRFLGTVAGGLVAAPLALQAQTRKTARIGMLDPFSTAEGLPYRQAFSDALRELGYVEGRNVIVDVRTSDRDTTKVPVLVDELIALKPDVLVGNESAAVLIREKTTSIPIVLLASFDPVGAGLAQSLRRPGMNVTGVTLLLDQLTAKHVEIMREIRPRLARVGLIFDATGPSICKVVEEGARQGGKRAGAILTSYQVANRQQIEAAFTQMRTARPEMLIPCPMPLLFNNRDLLFESAVRLRIPFTSFVTANLPLGVLFAYAPSFAEGYRRAATYVAKILKGMRPEDLPIEQPTKIALVINMKTAKVMGLTIPPSLLQRADQVIE